MAMAARAAGAREVVARGEAAASGEGGGGGDMRGRV